jgi:hypothetical protein
MPSGKYATDVRPAAEQLARALRSGLELRWSIPCPPADMPKPFPPRGHVRPYLEPHADSLRFRLARRRHPLHAFVRIVRYLARALIAPWLRFQAQFNLCSVSVMEQIELRVRVVEETEHDLRQTIDALQKQALEKS